MAWWPRQGTGGLWSNNCWGPDLNKAIILEGRGPGVSKTAKARPREQCHWGQVPKWGAVWRVQRLSTTNGGPSHHGLSPVKAENEFTVLWRKGFRKRKRRARSQQSKDRAAWLGCRPRGRMKHPGLELGAGDVTWSYPGGGEVESPEIARPLIRETPRSRRQGQEITNNGNNNDNSDNNSMNTNKGIT
jgi:hypothetical protein